MDFHHSEEDVPRNDGSEENIYDQDSGEILSEVMTCISRYSYHRLQLFDFKILPVSRKHSSILSVDINMINSMVFHKLVYLQW